MSVTQASPTAGAPKKTDDKSFFDVSIAHLLAVHINLAICNGFRSFCLL